MAGVFLIGGFSLNKGVLSLIHTPLTYYPISVKTYKLYYIAALVIGGTIYYVSKRKNKTKENIRENDLNNV